MCVQYVRFHLLYIFCLFHSTSQQHLYIYPYGATAHTWEPVWCGRVEGNWWLWITNPALSLAQLSTDGSSYRRSRHVTAPYQPNGSSKSIKDFNFVSKEEFYFWCSIFFPHFRVFFLLWLLLLLLLLFFGVGVGSNFWHGSNLKQNLWQSTIRM